MSIHGVSYAFSALVNSGAALTLIDTQLLKQLDIPTMSCEPAINVIAVNNKPIGEGISLQTTLLRLCSGSLLRHFGQAQAF